MNEFRRRQPCRHSKRHATQHIATEFAGWSTCRRTARSAATVHATIASATTSRIHPYLGYGRSKKDAEIAVLNAVGKGLNAVMVRPPWFYGPHQPARQTTFFTMVKNGEVPDPRWRSARFDR